MPAVPPYIHRSPFGSSFRPCCPNTRRAIRSAATALAFPTGPTTRRRAAIC
jgi:hypothetical protein